MKLKFPNVTLIMVLMFISLKCAAGIGDYGGHVYFNTYYRNQELNPFQIFPRQLNYFINPALSHISFTIHPDRPSIHINMMSIIQEAMAQWQPILGEDLVFTPVSRENDAQLVITAEQGSATSGTFAITRLAQPGGIGVSNPDPQVTFYLRGIESFNFENLRSWMTPDTSDEDLLRVVIRYLAMHELGHVLGFDHPNPETHWGDILFTRFGFGRIVVVEHYENVFIPLMEADTVGYFMALHFLLGRPLTVSDVSISPQEHFALTRLRIRARMCHPNDLSFQSLSHKNRPLTDADDCARFRVISPAAANAAAGLLLLHS